MESRIQTVAIALTVALLLIVVELVRRRRLLERYALLWLLCTGVLLVISIWRDMLMRVAKATGILYAPNALFLVALVFVLFLLLHFSVAVSRLTDQSKILAQRLAALEERIRRTELAAEDDSGAEEPERRPAGRFN